MTEVKVLRDNGDIESVGFYTLPGPLAVVAASRQAVGDWNTWAYPTPAEAGVRPMIHRPDVAVLGNFYGWPRE